MADEKLRVQIKVVMMNGHLLKVTKTRINLKCGVVYPVLTPMIYVCTKYFRDGLNISEVMRNLTSYPKLRLLNLSRDQLDHVWFKMCSEFTEFY